MNHEITGNKRAKMPKFVLDVLACPHLMNHHGDLVYLLPDGLKRAKKPDANVAFRIRSDVKRLRPKRHPKATFG